MSLTTPKHSRQSSNTDSISRPQSDSISRANSRIVGNSPVTPSRAIIGSSTNSIDPTSLEVFSSNGLLITPSNNTSGKGNLADELADAWDDDGEEGSEFDLSFQQQPDLNPSRDSGVDVSSPQLGISRRSSLLPSLARGHKRLSSEYDGSEYGDNSILEADSIPTALQAQMDLVESLVRRGIENNGSDGDGIVKRVIEELRDLGGQSKIESGTTRLITAHSALSTYFVHQARVIQSLAYPLFSPMTIPLDEDFINDLLPILIQTCELIPRPSTTAYNSLVQLHSLTADIIQSLNHLSDSLHMSRQSTVTATRRLRIARELVTEMRKEEITRIESESWLKNHNSSERLHNRECARVCGDVLGGFDEVCNGWRARLVAQAELIGA
ncbi:hypothetical protein HI914_00991 [Erysiphe necator]|uniref:Uncharacterized protein n=1 Tax=Uncinula necator TaxID=52586 RepID=A0A0B1P5W8_UNCNE|nr:hypothetical protein HI914_00991 [Erysiphe necator]KHJ32079.1 hypothetical protein EV44_g4890 [Erysiphe necator]